MGHPRLDTVINLEGIRQWMHSKNLISLNDISIWESYGKWKGCKDINPPKQLEGEYRSFRLNLHEKYPIHHGEKDQSRWGISREYSIKERYKLLEGSVQSQASMLWRKFLNPIGIPKIKNFL